MTPAPLPAWAAAPLARVLAPWPGAGYSVQPGERGAWLVRIVLDGVTVAEAVLMPPLEDE